MRALEADKRVDDKSSVLCKLPVLMMMGSNDKATSSELAQGFTIDLRQVKRSLKFLTDTSMHFLMISQSFAI